MLKQVDPSVPESPERLLQQLDTQIAFQRHHRQHSEGRRLAVLAGGLLFVMAAATGALLYLFSMLSDMNPRSGSAAEETSLEAHP
jgi:hypothetical protein